MTIPTNDDIINQCADVVASKHAGIENRVDDFIFEVYKEFIDMKLLLFPLICKETREQNQMKWKVLNEVGHKGKYTDTYGWSEDHSFKFEFEIPDDMYFFMRNLVYKGFWDDSNKRVADAFLNAICRGDDPEETLIKVKKLYGNTVGDDKIGTDNRELSDAQVRH